MKKQTLFSPFDGLSLSVAISEPQGAPIGIIQFSHGMAEHKERYFPFMEYLSENGYILIASSESPRSFSRDRCRSVKFSSLRSSM